MKKILKLANTLSLSLSLSLIFLFSIVNYSEGSKIKNSSKKTASQLTFVFISDTHGSHNQINVPEADFLIFCGDMCPRGRLEDVQSFAKFLKKLPHKHKVVIAGNHDRPFENEKEKHQAEEMITSSGSIYLNDSGVEIEGIKIWGSPIQPWFLDWAFNRSRGEDIKKHWDMIPAKIDLLITHGPPYGILDKNSAGEKTGCKDLYKKVNEIKPKVHAFGHIHEGYGKIKKNGTVFINASNLNQHYRPTNSPIVINWNSLRSK